MIKLVLYTIRRILSERIPVRAERHNRGYKPEEGTQVRYSAQFKALKL